MPIKKKSASENEAVTAAETTSAKPRAASKKAAVAGKAAAPAAAHKTTHKPAARKAAAPKSTQAETGAVKAQAVETKRAGFDSAAHHAEIAREAYFLWMARNCAHGHQHEDWLRATDVVRSRYA